MKIKTHIFSFILSMVLTTILAAQNNPEKWPVLKTYKGDYTSKFEKELEKNSRPAAFVENPKPLSK